jgi:hypothetical protein
MIGDLGTRPPPAARLGDAGLPTLRDVRGHERDWAAGLLRVLTPLPEPARWRLLGSLVRQHDVQAVLDALWTHRDLDHGDAGQVAVAVALLAEDEVWLTEMLCDGPVAVAMRIAAGRGLDLIDRDTAAARLAEFPRAVASALVGNPRTRRRPDLAAALMGAARRALGPAAAARLLAALPDQRLRRELPELMHVPGLDWRRIARGRGHHVLEIVAADLAATPSAWRALWWTRRGFPAAVGIVRAVRHAPDAVEVATAVVAWLSAQGPADRGPSAWLWRADAVHTASSKVAAYLLAPSRHPWLARHRPSRAVRRVLAAHGAAPDDFCGRLRPFGRPDSAPHSPVARDESSEVVLPAWGANRREIVEVARTRHDLLPAFLAHVHPHHGDRADDPPGRWRPHPLPTRTWLATHRRTLAEALTEHRHGQVRLWSDPAAAAIAAALPETPLPALLALLDDRPRRSPGGSDPRTHQRRRGAWAAYRHDPTDLLDQVLAAATGGAAVDSVTLGAGEIIALAVQVAPQRAAQLLSAWRAALPPGGATDEALRRTVVALRLPGWTDALVGPVDPSDASVSGQALLRGAIRDWLGRLGEPGDSSGGFHELWQAARHPAAMRLVAHELAEHGPLVVPLLQRPRLKDIVRAITEPLHATHPVLAERLAGRWDAVPSAVDLLWALCDQLAGHVPDEHLEYLAEDLEHNEPLIGLEMILDVVDDREITLGKRERDALLNAARVWNTDRGAAAAGALE